MRFFQWNLASCTPLEEDCAALVEFDKMSADLYIEGTPMTVSVSITGNDKPEAENLGCSWY